MAVGRLLGSFRCTVSAALAAPGLRAPGSALAPLAPNGARWASGLTAAGNGLGSESTLDDLWGPIRDGQPSFLREPKPHLLERYLSYDNQSRADKMKAELSDVRAKFQRHELDSGSCQVQVAALTHKIAAMTEHLKEHHKDNHSRRGLIAMLQRRAKLLKYMRKNEHDNYQRVLYDLGLKDRTFVGSKY
jgi:ribosomal protein S15